MLPIAAQHEPTHAPHKNTDLNFISKEMRKHWFFCRWYFLARNKNFTERLPSTLMQSDPDRCGKALLVRNMYTYAHSSVQCPRKGHNQRVKKKKSQNRAIPITTSAPTALNTTVVALPYTQDVPFTRFCFWSVHAQRCKLVKNSAKHRNKYGNNKAHLNSKQITGSSVLWATSDLAKKKRFGGCLPSERIHTPLCVHTEREKSTDAQGTKGKRSSLPAQLRGPSHGAPFHSIPRFSCPQILATNLAQKEWSSTLPWKIQLTQKWRGQNKETNYQQELCCHSSAGISDCTERMLPLFSSSASRKVRSRGKKDLETAVPLWHKCWQHGPRLYDRHVMCSQQ